METLRIYKIYPGAIVPKHQTEQSACFDLSFYGVTHEPVKGFTETNKPIERWINPQNQSFTISPGDRMMVPTGLILDIPEGYSVRVHARSGMSLKQGLVLANAEGVIDSDYVNELMVLVNNISQNNITIKNGDRIAQAELVKGESYEVKETPIRPILKTSRTGGMGSTGINITDPSIIKITVAEPQMEKRRGRPKKNVSNSP